MSTKPTTPPPNQPAKTRRRPADDLVAANRIEQILLPLTIEQADWVLKRANEMHRHRCELVNKPPFIAPEGTP